MNQDQLLDEDIFDHDYEQDVAIIKPANFAVLYIVTLGVYGLWWMYKQWKFFKEKSGEDIYPVARAIFAIFFLHGLFERIESFAHSRGYTKSYSSTGLFVLFIVFNLLARLPDPLWLISLLGFFAFWQPIQALNHALRGSEVYRTVELDGFNWRQWILIVIGGIFFLLIIIGLFFSGETY